MALLWRDERGFRVADGQEWHWRLTRGPMGHWVLWRMDKAKTAPEQMGLFRTEEAAKRQAENLDKESHGKSERTEA